MKKRLILSAALLSGVLGSCEKDTTQTEETEVQVSGAQVSTKLPEATPIYTNLPSMENEILPDGTDSQSGDLSYNVLMAEYITSGEADRIGRTVFFDDRGNRQLAGDFVPELALDGTPDISYYVDNNRPSGDLPAAVTEAAIDRAMASWNEVNCSELGMTKVPATDIPTGFIATLFGYGGSFDYIADVTHAGWLPRDFFDLLDEDGGDFILAATFTIVFTDSDGNLVDTDNNGKYDVAWREIYYNDELTWQDGDTFDVESIALHEAGHGLSQAHFGAAFITGPKNKLHFAPRAVMNAAYSGVQTQIGKSDKGGHCSNWSSWPGK
jgi:hypothetical protein